jgi:hypothetical protein
LIGLSTPQNLSAKIATIDDEEDIFWFLVNELWVGNNNGWGFPYDPVIVTRKIQAATRPDASTRSDPTDKDFGIVGIIRGSDGAIIASIGLYLCPPMWFTSIWGMNELWLTVASKHRSRNLEKRLFDFADWAHESMKSNPAMADHVFPLYTGFYHDGEKLNVMERLWRRLSGVRKIGVLYVKD